MHSSSLLVARRPSLESQYDSHRRHVFREISSSSSSPSLLYDTVGSSVRLRPTAPASFRRALWQEAGRVQELTLLGFSEVAVAEELYELIVARQMPLHTLRIVSLDLWSATHLQSTSALAVGPALAKLVVVPHLQVLDLQRVCMGRSPAHLQALAQALRHHPNLQVVCMDAHSTQLQSGRPANNSSTTTTATSSSSSATLLQLDALVDALATCKHLETLQIYLSGYQRGRLQHSGPALARLLMQLRELSMHLVSWPCRHEATLLQAARASQTLCVLHWSHADPHKSLNWSDFIKNNTSLHSVSLSVPVAQRAPCWKALATHPRISSARLSLAHSLPLAVPAFMGKTNTAAAAALPLDHVMDKTESAALAQALSVNPRLVHIPAAQATTAHQALVQLNQGPRSRHVRQSEQWWQFVASYTHDLNALWLLLRLHPQSVTQT